MAAVEIFFKKYAIVIQLLLFLIAIVFLSLDINRPLVDYDEATYAHVIVDTLKSGDISTFQLGGQNWFEKPPLYLWLTMASVKIFGVEEYAFRLPAVAAALLCCWLVYLIIRKQTKDEIAAAFGFLILLFSTSFFIFAREVRLDSAVTASILAALFFWLKGLSQEKYLFWFFPLIAIGILIKSVIGLFILPAIFFYSIFYRRWDWLKSKYLWIGFLLSLVILVPWHLVETIRFGQLFWDDYFGRQILHRATSTMTGTDNYYDYIAILWTYIPWIWVLFLGLGFAIYLNLSKKFSAIPLKTIIPPLFSAAFVVAIFTLQKSHLGTYIIPVFPLLAIGIALLFHYLASISATHKKILSIIFLILIIFSAFICITNLYTKVPAYVYEEKSVGQIYANNPPAPLYALDWNVHETVNFYGNTRLSVIDPGHDSGRVIKAPFYLFVDLPAETYFFYDTHTPSYEGLKLLYQGKMFALIRGEKDLQLPSFICCSH